MTAQEQAWAALDGPPDLLRRVAPAAGGAADGLRSALPVMDLARACVTSCSLAAAELAARRNGGPVPAVRVEDGAVATAFTSERHLRLDGRPAVTFAPLSKFWRAADGWVRTHANYPHHRARLLAALGAPAGAGPDVVGKLIEALPARTVEETVYAAGGLAVAVRSPQDWDAHPQGRAAAAQPLVARERIADAPARTLPPAPSGPLLPAAGLRVLDLTRVLAGPVATRTLGLLGADVLRVDSPLLPELEDQHADTGFGKRSALLDLEDRSDGGDRALLEKLLALADVVVTGYRPGALDEYGLSAHDMAERRPGLVVVQIRAWGTEGPWAGRRGFDSLVQAASGIAATEAGPDGVPGALPAQALDHGSGYLMAAAVLRAVTDQTEYGGSRLVQLSLARTASWLMHGIGAGPASGACEASRAAEASGAASPASGEGADPLRWLAETDSELGRIRHALPPLAFDGGPRTWAQPPVRWGRSVPAWL
ncbi:CoA transferase [Streptomyces thermolineatus]|uniref:CoA transferase n=1 Tax=Streptomyces thermolineatus TaxID=44033 RepID=A0ABN3L7M7_9ACTN